MWGAAAVEATPASVGAARWAPLAPLQQTWERLTPAPGIYQPVAEAEGRVVGFVIEGTMPRRGFGGGGWMDAHRMAGCTTAEPVASASAGSWGGRYTRAGSTCGRHR